MPVGPVSTVCSTGALALISRRIPAGVAAIEAMSVAPAGAASTWTGSPGAARTASRRMRS